MSQEREIHYEPHPVTPERKAELMADGYRILDARFKPEEAESEPEEKPKRGRPAAKAQDAE